MADIFTKQVYVEKVPNIWS